MRDAEGGGSKAVAGAAWAGPTALRGGPVDPDPDPGTTLSLLGIAMTSAGCGGEGSVGAATAGEGAAVEELGCRGPAWRSEGRRGEREGGGGGMWVVAQSMLHLPRDPDVDPDPEKSVLRRPHGAACEAAGWAIRAEGEEGLDADLKGSGGWTVLDRVWRRDSRAVAVAEAVAEELVRGGAGAQLGEGAGTGATAPAPAATASGSRYLREMEGRRGGGAGEGP